MKKDFFCLKTVFALFLLVVAFFLSVLLGSQKISFFDFFQAILDKSSFFHTIIFSIRLPRAFLAILTGALLASSGAVFQMFFRNPLAEPGIIGISSSATLGAVIAQTLGFSSAMFGSIAVVNVFAFFGALFSGILITFISNKMHKQNAITLLLCGTALGSLYSAISSILLIVNTKQFQMQGIYVWILGSFNGRSVSELKFIIFPAILSICMMLFIAPKLDVMTGGGTVATALGLNIFHLRTAVLIASSLAISACVCAGGTINFVGLIAPHIVRKIYGEKYNKGIYLILLSFIYGAVLVLVSDTIARIVIRPSELPTGLITSVLGVPFFLSLIWSKRGNV